MSTEEVCHEDDYFQKLSHNTRLPTLMFSAFVRKAWYCGRSSTTPINLTRDGDFRILLTYEHLISLYDYDKRQDNFLYGHKNKIACTAIDGRGKWLVSSDVGPQPLIIIWDLSSCVPVRVVENASETGCSQLWLSWCGRQLVTVTQPDQDNFLKLISFWDWSSKRRGPDVSLEINENEVGRLKKINFCYNCCDYIMLTTENHIFFLTVEENQETLKKSLVIYPPLNSQQIKDAGVYNDSTYMRNTPMAISVTSKGNIIVWSDYEFLAEVDKTEDTVTNNKNFVRQLELDSSSITSVYNIDEYIATVNSKNIITFYDTSLIVVHKLADMNGGSIINLSFNLFHKVIIKDNIPTKPKASSYDFERKMKSLQKSSLKNVPTRGPQGTIINRTARAKELIENKQTVYSISNPRGLLSIRDFLITTDQGSMYYININQPEMFEIKATNLRNPTVIDSHPREDIIAIGTEQGIVYLFDYANVLLIKESDVLNVESENAKKAEKETDSRRNSITCIKYTQEGWYIGCGTALGTVAVLNGQDLQLVFSLSGSDLPIRNFLFSKLNTYFAFYDEGGMLSLFSSDSNPKCIGKTNLRTKLSGAVFLSTSEYTRLFTVGTDGYLFKFEIVNDGSQLFQNVNTVKVEKFSKLCHLDVLSDTILLCFNDKLQCRYISVETMKVIGTVRAPATGPVQFTQFYKESPNEEFIFFSANNSIGLIKLPFDGNPYRVITHRIGSDKVHSACIGKDKSKAFSVSDKGDFHMWQVNTEVVKKVEAAGGEDAVPFVKALGMSPSLPSVEETQLMFEAVREMAIMESDAEPPQDLNMLPLGEVPKFIRGLGAFPTNAEENDLKPLNLEEPDASTTKEKLSYEECLQLYYNYQGQLSFNENEVKHAFETLCKEFRGETEESLFLTKPELLSLLESEGYTRAQVLSILRELLPDKLRTSVTGCDDDPEEIYEHIPETITYEYFTNNLLGLFTNYSYDKKIEE